MKNKFLILSALIVISAAGIYSCQKGLDDNINPSESKPIIQLTETSVAIFTDEGDDIITKDNLMNTFNDLIPENETYVSKRVDFIKSDDGIYKLGFFIIDGNEEEMAMVYHLFEMGNGDIGMNGSSEYDRHTCTGSPCNHCKLVSEGGSWTRDYSCSCEETPCSACKCNHTVSTVTIAPPEAPNPIAIIAALLEL